MKFCGSKFVIYSPSFNEGVGGSIVLHRLCDLLNKVGARAYLYPIRPYFDMRNPVASTKNAIYHFAYGKSSFKTFPGFNTPIASFFDSANAIVVYPEVIHGNPLGARRVVRWLLHKPGFHNEVIGYGAKDVLFYFQEAFNEHELNLTVGGELQVFHVRTDIYKRTNYGQRSGTCYMLRKGKGRPIAHELTNSILIDDLSHEETAKIFNQSESFISYDMYTMYSQYAALCGCVSIVVPEEGLSKAAWQPEEGLRLGISYGFDEADWARETQGRMVDYLRLHEATELQSVKNFILFCNDYFD